MVKRVYVEKRPGFDGAAAALAAELRDILGISALVNARIINCYDVQGISDDLFAQCVPTVFSEPQTDTVAYQLDEALAARGTSFVSTLAVFQVEYLPGQFDQRAESASECIQLISQDVRPLVRSSTMYVLDGNLSTTDVEAIKRYIINPVESRETTFDVPATLEVAYPTPADVQAIESFDALDSAGRAQLIADFGLAMDDADLQFCQDYFTREARNPTVTELKMIDTYWSDHCRHTTFGTQFEDVDIARTNVRIAYDHYQEVRQQLGRTHKPECLMDIATLGARYLADQGILKNLDESDEINACTVRVMVDVDGKDEEWLYLFKNETHNHPTEIEPFGGAATCVGGAIRDPLSGRAYVYQAMRVTGAADPRVPVSETIPGKLPQRKLVTTAAHGYSSYGNQIGLATGQVSELYHPGYAAKRMEIGAVVGAAPAKNVRRETPAPGDVVVLLGGRTGRDGIGGATGSSKAHNAESLTSCGAEVQKGNAPVERKIQRLFRNGEACRMIKRCNDFGAGGVSVAIGELADGLDINLDAVPLKYRGLDGSEIALSESQERMAVVLAPGDVEAFIELAHAENLEATPVATVNADARVRMTWRGQTIVDISRDFLASNGAAKRTNVRITDVQKYHPPGCKSYTGDVSFAERLRAVLTDLNVASNKGLAERFDSTIGAASVLMPFGGKTQLAPAQAMVAKLPVQGETSTCSGMAWGFNPYLSAADPFVGAYCAVVESVCKLVATGFERANTYLTFQEYFERLRGEADRWGKPVAALLGAFEAQLNLEVGAIGGKDSMSGSFEDLDVPPTLVSFATAVGKDNRILSPEFKRAGSVVYRIATAYSAPVDDTEPNACLMPKSASMRAVLDFIEHLIGHNKISAAAAIGFGGAAETLFKMCVGNSLGIKLEKAAADSSLFCTAYGTFIVEAPENLDAFAADKLATANFTIERLGETIEQYQLQAPDVTLDLAALQEEWESTLEEVFPYRSKAGDAQAFPEVPQISDTTHAPAVYSGASIARPRVVIPVFPGNNCEYDSARAFEAAGAVCDTFIVNNLTPASVAESTRELARRIRASQIVMIPGGFSGGDEPDGSAKFITAFFRAPEVTEAVRDLLFKRDGLMLGICNGFQALVKLGLVPYGDIVPMTPECATLTFNTIGRHQSRIVNTRVASTLSPWLSKCAVGDIHSVAISHGEGRFVAPPALLETLVAQGQVATQYVDAQGMPSMDLAVNPNGSLLAIEGITSPDGRVLGKMGHSERRGNQLYKNITGNLFQPIFEGGVDYFA